MCWWIDPLICSISVDVLIVLIYHVLMCCCVNVSVCGVWQSFFKKRWDVFGWPHRFEWYNERGLSHTGTNIGTTPVHTRLSTQCTQVHIKLGFKFINFYSVIQHNNSSAQIKWLKGWEGSISVMCWFADVGVLLVDCVGDWCVDVLMTLLMF
jgi:hypothetical protein